MKPIDRSQSTIRRLLGGLATPADTPAEPPERYAALVWSVITEPGDAVAGGLVGSLGADAALSAVISGAAPALEGHTERAMRQAMDRWRPRLSQDDVESAASRAHRVGVRLVVPADVEWPERLADLGPHAPLALWTRGEDLGFLHETSVVAVVGARAATTYGEHVAAEMSAELARSGVTVVSGAAYGIDGAAHRSTLAAGGRTVALLAGGADRPYPTGHSALIDQIASQGAVVSETPCGTAPTKWRFLARNRLIAALADATVVVEAGARSGSLNTAAHAAALGRPLAAVPGPVTSAASAGCHHILREFDGVCVTSADDVRELIGIGDRRPSVVSSGRTDDFTRLLDALSVRSPRDVDDIARRSGLSPADVRALVGLAALSGDAERTAAGWRRVAGSG